MARRPLAMAEQSICLHLLIWSDAANFGFSAFKTVREFGIERLQHSSRIRDVVLRYVLGDGLFSQGPCSVQLLIRALMDCVVLVDSLRCRGLVHERTLA